MDFILEMLTNRSFTLHTSDGQHSQLRRLRNGVPQGSVLAPMLFNIYLHDLPPTLAKKYGYADDLAILLSDKRWETIEEVLTGDMSTMSTYLKNWPLKLSVDHILLIPSQQPRGKAGVQSHGGWQPAAVQGNTNLLWSEAPDLEKMSAKTTSRVSLIRHNLAGTTWGAPTHLHPGSGLLPQRVLCTSLVQKPTKKLDVALNNSLRTVSEFQRATPVNHHIPILSGIAPAALRRKAVVLALARITFSTRHSASLPSVLD